MGRGRQVYVEDLVDASTIADRLGLSHRETVSNFVVRYPEFPKALGMWGRTRLWNWPDVEQWAKSTGRLP